MASTIVKYNKNLSFELNLDIINPEKLNNKWFDMYFTNKDFYNILLDIADKHGKCAAMLYIHLSKKCKVNSIFIETTITELAKELNISREYATKSMQILINYSDNIEKKPIIFVKRKLYAINPKYVWRMSMINRAKILEFIKQYGYEELYIVLKAKKKSELLDDILNVEYDEYN